MLMDSLSTEIGGQRYSIDLENANSIAIDVKFDGDQPSHFAAKPATKVPMNAGQFVGSTIKGGSCNVDVMTINPHCNGTHTETVGHIVNDSIAIASAAIEGLYVAMLITVDPIKASQCNDTYQPALEADDLVVGRNQIEAALADAETSFEAIVVRTLPNDKAKKTFKYGDSVVPAFFTNDAMQWIAESGIKHLLVDLPSIDRMHDDGKLSNHHMFWNVEPGSNKLGEDSWPEKTISEMVFVDDGIVDGAYLLNLQVAAFSSDVSPSRPILYPLKPL